MKSLKDSIAGYTYVYVDGMNLCSRSFHGMRQFEYKGHSTGMLYGVARLYATYHKAYPGATFVFLWEGRNSFRKREYPTYKASRKHEPRSDTQEFFDNIAYIRDEVLPHMGAQQVSVEGLEADDLAHYFSEVVRDRVGSRALLVSGDQDWYAFTHSRCDLLYRNITKTYNSICVELDYPAERIVQYKILKGDSSDDVSGIPRFPTKLAVKLVQTSDDITTYPGYLRDWGYDKWADALVRNQWIIDRNTILISSAEVHPEIMEVGAGELCVEKLVEVLEHRGITSIANTLRSMG